MAAKSFEELNNGALAIKNNELPESNTHTLVGTQLVDMVDKEQEIDGKVSQLRSDLLADKTFIIPTFQDGYYYINNGGVVETIENAGSKYARIDLQGVRVGSTVKLYFTQWEKSSRHIGLGDAAGNWIAGKYVVAGDLLTEGDYKVASFETTAETRYLYISFGFLVYESGFLAFGATKFALIGERLEWLEEKDAEIIPKLNSIGADVTTLNNAVFGGKVIVPLVSSFSSGFYFGSQGELIENAGSSYAAIPLPIIRNGAIVRVKFTSAPSSGRWILLAKSSSSHASGYYVVKYDETWQRIQESALVLQPDGTYMAEFSMPSDAEFLLISYSTTANSFVSAEIEYEGESALKNYSPLRGKKWCVCGDSYTFGDFGSIVPEDEKYISEEGKYKSYRANYGYIIGNRYDMEIDLNAKNGAAMVTVGGSGFSKWDGGRLNIPSYELIPLDADYITLAFGLNEISTKITFRYPEGDNTSTDATTIWGAWNKVIEYIQTNIPNAKLGVIIMDGWMTEKCRELLKDICTYWGVPYLDLLEHINVCLITSLAGEPYDQLSPTAVSLRNARYDGGNTHPSPFANYQRANLIAEWLKSL